MILNKKLKKKIMKRFMFVESIKPSINKKRKNIIDSLKKSLNILFYKLPVCKTYKSLKLKTFLTYLFKKKRRMFKIRKLLKKKRFFKRKLKLFVYKLKKKLKTKNLVNRTTKLSRFNQHSSFLFEKKSNFIFPNHSKFYKLKYFNLLALPKNKKQINRFKKLKQLQKKLKTKKYSGTKLFYFKEPSITLQTSTILKNNIIKSKRMENKSTSSYLSLFNMFHKKTRTFKLTSLKKKYKIQFSRLIIQQKKRYVKRAFHWLPRKPKFMFKSNRIHKKLAFLFRYFKRFNNYYPQFKHYQKLKETKWVNMDLSYSYKLNSLYERKRKKLLVLNTQNKSIVLEKKRMKSLNIYKTFFINKKMFSSTKIKNILRFKRKYLRVKGFFRKYQDMKIKVNFESKNVYDPIQIQYKKIRLQFKHRPIPYYFVEFNFKTLEFKMVSDVDFLYFPYRTFLDFKTISTLFPM